MKTKPSSRLDWSGKKRATAPLSEEGWTAYTVPWYSLIYVKHKHVLKLNLPLPNNRKQALILHTAQVHQVAGETKKHKHTQT
jgi:hypothetical protein